MAGAKEIRTKIKSVQNTQKITKAMEMVAASKMRRAQERMRAARPYAHKIRNVVGHLARANAEYKHPYMIEREPRRVGFIVISSDRGLCGGLNTNMFRIAINAMSEWHDKDMEVDVCAVGAKALAFFKRLKTNVVSGATHLGDRPVLSDLIGAVRVMLSAYNDGKIDRVYLVSNEFVNTVTHAPTVERLLPIGGAATDKEFDYYWDYIYEPDAKEIVDGLMTRYIESLIYQAVVENVACEMAARMVAMKAASDNASDIIDELQLVYNKARQAAITQELSEIVSGAAAV